MLARLTTREGQTQESARRVFDSQIGASRWAVPGREAREGAKRDPRAPWWWQDEEEASESFLRSMGVKL